MRFQRKTSNFSSLNSSAHKSSTCKRTKSSMRKSKPKMKSNFHTIQNKENKLEPEIMSPQHEQSQNKAI